jgi:alanine racemase
MSHLARADEPRHPANDAQLAAFAALPAAGLERSLASSAAILSRPDMHFDWIRPGIMLYGASPFAPDEACSAVLRPVMSLESRLMAVSRHNKGDSIGYGQSWTCPQAMPVGVVACGYADGYPRHAPSGMPVLVNGKVAPLVGRVSMDMLCVDLRGQPEARAGDPVQLWGSCLPVEAVAARAGTISYELLCNVGQRVPREYLHG